MEDHLNILDGAVEMGCYCYRVFLLRTGQKFEHFWKANQIWINSSFPVSYHEHYSQQRSSAKTWQQ